MVEEEAFVMRLRKNGVIVLIPKYGLEVPVFLSKKGEPPAFTLSADGMALASAARAIRVLDKLRVRVSVETHGNHRSSLKVDLVGDGGAPAEAPAAASTPPPASKRPPAGAATGASPAKKVKKQK